ncbi:MAG: signal peptidase II [Clostridiales bacterium]|nr:signal peptidase II [Clostridiales bacterium]
MDLVSKTIVEHTMELGQTVAVIPKLLNFSYTVNTRAAFGSDFGLGKLLGDSGVMIFFIIVTLLAVGFFGYLLFKKPKKGMLYRISFALIIAGALGNLYDRAFLSGVRDFIQFEYLGLEIFGSTTFAIFNIADVCVVVGTVMLLVYFIFFDPTLKSHKGHKSETQEEQEIANSASQIEETNEVCHIEQDNMTDINSEVQSKERDLDE